jgi:hypothetical protein
LVWNMLIGQIFQNGRAVLKSVVNYWAIQVRISI